MPKSRDNPFPIDRNERCECDYIHMRNSKLESLTPVEHLSEARTARPNDDAGLKSLGKVLSIIRFTSACVFKFGFIKYAQADCVIM